MTVDDAALAQGVERFTTEVATLTTAVQKDRRGRRAFGALAVLVFIAFGVLYFQQRHATHAYVGGKIAVLEKKNADLRQENDDLRGDNTELKDVNSQLTSTVVSLAKRLQANGIDPGQIVIKPTTTTTARP